jgi:NTE family protein
LYREQGLLKGLILPYLGQQDEALFRDFGEENIPQDFVKKTDVEGYPTDFAAMPEDDIKNITLRGEQLTNMLIDAYWSDKSNSV